MKPTFLKYFFLPVLFLLLFQGLGKGGVGSGFEKEVGEMSAVRLEEHSNESLFNLIKNAPNDATRIRYSNAWNHLDLAGSSSKLDPSVLTKLGDDLLDADFKTFLEGGVGRVKAWEAINDLSYAIRTNTTLLSKGDELLSLGFSPIQFRTLATLDNANALDIAKRLRNNHNMNFDKVTNIVDNSYILGGDFITSIDNISQGPGKLLDPNGLNSKLQEAVNTNNPMEGIKLTADDGGKRIKNGSDIHIENGNADLEDLTLGESIQHKLVNGSGSTAARDNLASSTNQLRGSGGEFPTQPTKIAYVKINNVE